MKETCTSCESKLSTEESENGVCHECGYEFNPNHDDWELESPEQYSGTFINAAGEEKSISRMAEQLLHGKILKRFGVFAATTDGVECLDHYYCLPRERLEESDWVAHMKSKTWVKIDDFKGALDYVIAHKK